MSIADSLARIYAHIEDTFVGADVVPAQSESFALSEAGSDEDLDEVGHERIGRVAVPQEGGSLLECPDMTLGGGRAGDDRGPCGIVVEPVVPDGLAQRAGERGEDAVDGDRTPAARELGAYEGGDVAVAEVVELDLPERGMRSSTTYAW
ncbi:hypothetical protein [Streptomyces orinoci]|uniref:Uncharacterized protein n=1 Tax=Streptomyces orinoci TaxID=67339 RepID=A0ABV3K0D9_STRON|nr:hypothetical protein [Streptomyces orinoci]